jgi:hypothetical protein
VLVLLLLMLLLFLFDCFFFFGFFFFLVFVFFVNCFLLSRPTRLCDVDIITQQNNCEKVKKICSVLIEFAPSLGIITLSLFVFV